MIDRVDSQEKGEKVWSPSYTEMALTAFARSEPDHNYLLDINLFPEKIELPPSWRSEIRELVPNQTDTRPRVGFFGLTEEDKLKLTPAFSISHEPGRPIDLTKILMTDEPALSKLGIKSIGGVYLWQPTQREWTRIGEPFTPEIVYQLVARRENPSFFIWSTLNDDRLLIKSSGTRQTDLTLDSFVKEREFRKNLDSDKESLGTNASMSTDYRLATYYGSLKSSLDRIYPPRTKSRIKKI